jgi:ribosomal-protein-serine acetyltransferase
MNLMPVTIDCGEGLRLAVRREAEAEENFRLVAKNDAYLRLWLPWLDRCATVDAMRSQIVAWSEAAAKGESLQLSIRLEGELVGAIGYNTISNINRTARIGYWLSEHMRSRGLMSRAVRGLVGYGFENLGMNRLVIAAATGNHASRRVAERLGFRFEGVAREAEWIYGRKVDHAVYALLAAEWKALRA